MEASLAERLRSAADAVSEAFSAQAFDGIFGILRVRSIFHTLFLSRLLYCDSHLLTKKIQTKRPAPRRPTQVLDIFIFV